MIVTYKVKIRPIKYLILRDKVLRIPNYNTLEKIHDIENNILGIFWLNQIGIGEDFFSPTV